MSDVGCRMSDAGVDVGAVGDAGAVGDVVVVVVVGEVDDAGGGRCRGFKRILKLS